MASIPTGGYDFGKHGGKSIATSGTQLTQDRLQQEAARKLIRQGAAGRTSAAQDAVGRFRGLEQAGMTRAAQAAGQLMAQATGGVSGAGASGAVLAAGEEAGRQAESQYSAIAGQAAKDIFAAETAVGEAQMDQAEIMKGTTLSAERANKKMSYAQAVSGIMADLDAGVYDSEEQAMMAIAGLAASESDPEVQEYIKSLIRGMVFGDAVSRQQQEIAIQESVGGSPVYGDQTGNL
jgi:hypothetical protein